MARPPRFATIPLIMTLLLLVGLCVATTSFHQIRIVFTKAADTGSSPIVHRGQEFVVEGIVDRGDNSYRQIESVEVHLFAKDPESPGGEVRRDSSGADFDRVSWRFRGLLHVKANEDAAWLVVRVVLHDHIERMYGPDFRPLAGNELKVRVD